LRIRLFELVKHVSGQKFKLLFLLFLNLKTNVRIWPSRDFGEHLIHRQFVK